MINSQEIIERSLYDAILQVAITLNCSLDPNEYLPITPESVERCKKDKDRLDKYIAIYGTGNATSKDQKETPRIVLNARGFFPGSIGLPKNLIEKKIGIGYTAFETPYDIKFYFSPYQLEVMLNPIILKRCLLRVISL